ncbi:MAG: 4Fe-4S dicluster domain-containing protein [bacterium]|nr:4Fe-4S dicluster domain-containing protein [bacterium]
MNNSDLKLFVEYLLKKNYTVYSPVKESGRIVVRQITDSRKFSLVKERPLYSFKNFLLPNRKTIFSTLGGQDKNNNDQKMIPKQVLFGITVFDLRAVALLSQVFEKDPYYQDIISQTIFIGQSPVPEENSFYEKYEENILEHFKFDIFIESRSDQKDFRIFTGSKHGQRMLNDFGYDDFEHIEYAGAIPEEGLSDFHKILRGKTKLSYGSKIWKDLGKRCLGCDKCTIVCPTCFCFKIFDENNVFDNSIKRVRQWDSCFNSEFSEIAGGAKFLKTIEDRIYNWYSHKFVRIPNEYNLPGCVGCGRCADVCPAGINIKDEIFKIINFKANPPQRLASIAKRGERTRRNGEKTKTEIKNSKKIKSSLRNFSV